MKQPENFRLNGHKKQRLAVFHNPHKIWFKTPLDCFYNKVKSPNKYDWMLDNIPDGFLLAFYSDKGWSNGPLKGFFRIFNWNRLELLVWIYFNGLSSKKPIIIDSLDALDDEDVVFSFSYGNYNYSENVALLAEMSIDSMRRCRAKKIIHLSHYAYSIKRLFANLRLIEPDVLVAESNLRNASKFFCKYFSWYDGSMYVLPFKQSEKFKNITPFADRNNKAVATGTLSFVGDSAYVEYFGDGVLQALRKTILDNIVMLSKFVDSEISSIRSERVKDYVRWRNIWRRAGRFFINTTKDIVFFTRIILKSHNTLQGDRIYYRKNIVDIYNSYRMFICPEESTGLPGIGFVEGIACGAAYIGLKASMYEDIGMVSGIHYIGHDGTLEDIVAKIKYYQNNLSELEMIAEAGRRLIESIDHEKLLKDLFYIKFTSNLQNDS
jgi:hypothetical protein